MRYNHVVCKFDDEETGTVASKKEFAALSSLYEVKTLATIAGELNDTDVEIAVDESSEIPTIYSASNSGWLAIAVGSDISIFGTLEDFEYEITHPLTEDEVCGLEWLGESHFLAVSTTKKLFFYSVVIQRIVFSLEVNGQANYEFLTSTVDEVADQCLLHASAAEGRSLLFKIPNWSRLSSLQVSDSVLQSFNSVHVSQPSIGMDVSNVMFSGDTMELVAIANRTAPFRICSSMSQSFEQAPSGIINDSSFIRIRISEDGDYMFGLTTNGTLIVRDMWTNCIVTEKKINLFDDQEVLDFIFIERLQMSFDYTNIVLIVKTKSSHEMQVLSFPSLEKKYSVGVAAGTNLFLPPTTSDRVLLFIEPIPSPLSNSLDDVYARIREITEANPQVRLERLINRNLLDVAEQFAKEFKLDLQKVYVARMNKFFNDTRNDPENFDKLFSSLPFVTDVNMVGETCFNGATIFTRYAHIIGLLSYANSIPITDEETVDRISRVEHVLCTYRMVIGTEVDEYGSTSQWPEFVSAMDTNDWKNIFLTILANGRIKEARIIWHRHNQPLINEFHDQEGIIMQALFTTLDEVLNDNIGLWQDVVELLEYDIISACLTSFTNVFFPMLVNFLIRLAEQLEIFDVDHFPSNALNTVSTFDRAMNKMVEHSITPTKQAELAFAGSILCSLEIKYKTTEMNRLNTYRVNLIAIERLKNVYRCSLSYKTFVSLDWEKICYQIVQMAIQNPNTLKENVEKYARPYMAEHQLKPDETLYRYIQGVSAHSKGLVSATNPWDEQCLLVSETIKSTSLRCQAVVLVARGAHPPWSRMLSEAVTRTLNNNAAAPTLVKELRTVCLNRDMMSIMQSCSVPVGLMETILSTELQFIRFIRHALANTDNNTEGIVRLKVACNAMTIYRSLYPNCSSCMTLNYVHMLYAEFLRSTANRDMNISTILSEIERIKIENESTALLVTRMLLEKLTIDANCMIISKSKSVRDDRINALMLAESIMERYLRGESDYTTLHTQLTAIRKLQEKYDMWVSISHLNDKKWRMQEFRRFVTETERNLTDAYHFASCLLMSQEECAENVILLSLDAGNPQLTISVIRHALSSLLSQRLSPSLAEMCVIGCERSLYLLTRSCVSGAPDEVCDVAFDVLSELNAHILPDLTTQLNITDSTTSASGRLLEAVLKMSAYCSLSLMVIHQMFIADGADGDKKKQVEEGNSVHSSIFGLSRRVGTYRLSDEGPLFAKSEAVHAVISVAASVIRSSQMAESEREKFRSQQDYLWDNLFSFLSLQKQDLLEICFRAFAASLPERFTCIQWVEDGMHNCVKNVCERALQMHPSDLWTLVSLLAVFSSQTMHSIALELRRWVTGRKVPQTMINLMRIMQMMAIKTGITDLNKSLGDSFETQLWAKRLARVGVNAAICRQSVSVGIAEFAKKAMDPFLVEEFIDMLSAEHELPLRLRDYAVALIQRASTCNETEEGDLLLQCAEETLKIDNRIWNDENSFEVFRDLLYIVCPYNYKVIRFIISLLVKLGKSNEHSQFISSCSKVLRLVDEEASRISPICKAEFLWYERREKMLTNEKKDPNLAANMRQIYETGTDRAMTGDGDEVMDDLYEKQDVLVDSLPSLSIHRLPYHAFLYCGRGEIEKNLLPIVMSEVGIHNVLIWQSALRSVSWLKASLAFPRNRLLSHSVIKECEEFISKNEDMSAGVASVIEELLINTPVRNVVVDCISQSVRRLPLCQTKIMLLQMGIKVAETWLNAADIVPPIDDVERLIIEEQVNRLKDAHCKFNTELILKKAGLFDERTKDMIETPYELISHLYSQCVVWNDNDDREKKMRLMEELSSVSGNVNLADVQEGLIEKWLPGDDSNEAFAVDLNNTMGDTDVPTNVVKEDNDLYMLPFFSPSIDKIVHLVRMLEQTKSKMMYFIGIMNRDASQVDGKHATMVRAACVLLKAYTAEQLEAVKYNNEKICTELELNLYGRLLDISKIDIGLDQFRKTEKMALVAQLLSSIFRQTPQLTNVMASLVIDHQLTDRSQVDTLMTRLSGGRKKEILAALLKWCRDDTTLTLTKVNNLALLWARAFDWYFATIDLSTSEGAAELRHWLYFLISCPVSGKRAYDAIRNKLRMSNCCVAAMLVEVAAAPTQKCTMNIGNSDPQKDITLRWSTPWQKKSGEDNDSMDMS